MKNILATKDYSYFVEENRKGKYGAYAGSEWRPYNLSVIKQWVEMRDKYTFTDNEEEIYKGDWEQLDIKESHNKYGINYIYIDNDRMLWRIRQTGNEFYNNVPYKRTKEVLIREKVRQYLDEIYKECTTLPENFSETVVSEVTSRFVEDNYEAKDITKELTLEQVLWCYISKVQ